MIEYVTTTKQVRNLVNDCYEHEVLSIDIESTGLDPYTSKLLLVALSFGGNAYVLDMTALKKEDLLLLRGILEDPSILKLGHNLVIEWKFIKHNADIEIKNMYDTFLADKLLFAGFKIPFTLKAVTARRIGQQLDKAVRDTFLEWNEGHVFTQEQIEYSAHDVLHLEEIRAQQLRELNEKGLERIAALEMNGISVTARMELTGVPFNREMLEAMVEPFERFVYAADQAFQDMFINAGVVDGLIITSEGYQAFNSASQKQVLRMLHKVGVNVDTLDSKVVMRWDFQHRKTNKKRFGDIDYYELIDDEEIAEALDNYKVLDNPYLRAFAYLQGARKLLSTYIIGLLVSINPITHRIHPFFNQLGAGATGRYSSSTPNFQNLPNDKKLAALGLGRYSIRNCIEPHKTRRLIISDYSGIELVILATLSGDDKLLHEISIGDIHTTVTREILGYKEINKENKKKEPHKLWRDAAKTLSYAIAYGTTGKNIADTLNIMLGNFGFRISAQEGEDLIRAWYALFPKTAAYLNSNATMAQTKGYVCDTWGRRRHWDLSTFVDKWKYLAAGREGMNAPIQGTSATMTKRAMQLIDMRLNKNKARIIITVHDEIVVESNLSYVEEASAIMKWGMEEAIKETLPQIADMVGQYESFSAAPKVSDKYDK